MLSSKQIINKKYVSTSDACVPAKLLGLSVALGKEAVCFQAQLNFLLFVVLWHGVCATPSFGIPRSELLRQIRANIEDWYLKELPTCRHPHPGSKELRQGRLSTVDNVWITEHELACLGLDACVVYKLLNCRVCWTKGERSLMYRVVNFKFWNDPDTLIVDQ